MKQPSERNRELIRHIARISMVQWSEEPVTFVSGIKSRVYVSGREELTGDTDALFVIGSAIAHAAFMNMDPVNLTARKKLILIGIPTAGTPLAVAASLAWRAVMSDIRMGSRTMRTEIKAYGRAENRRWVDGEPRDDELYYTVDNVITDGQTKLEKIAQLREDGYPTETMTHIIVVDRKQGGVETLRACGHKVITLVDLPDIVEAHVTQGTWGPDRLKRYRAEQVEWTALHQ